MLIFEHEKEKIKSENGVGGYFNLLSNQISLMIIMEKSNYFDNFDKFSSIFLSNLKKKFKLFSKFKDLSLSTFYQNVLKLTNHIM